MGPVLKQSPILLQQMAELGGSVGLIAGKQDHVMSPGDRIDTVDLDEPECGDDVEQSVDIKPGPGRDRKALALKK